MNYNLSHNACVVATLHWPERLPDFSPVELLWDMVPTQRPQNDVHLEQQLRMASKNISHNKNKNFYDSLTIQACKKVFPITELRIQFVTAGSCNIEFLKNSLFFN